MTEKKEFTKLIPEETGHKDQKIDQLEIDNQCLKERLLEERFWWMFFCVFMFDAFIFTKMPSWGGPISLFLFQAIGLIALAKKCRVDIVEEISLKIIDGWLKK